MNNGEVANILQDIADMLEMKGESPFKIRAYQRAARSLEDLSTGVEQLVCDGTLKEVDGIGEAISKKITELVTTGHLQYYENLKAEFPEGISEILEIPGVGPKTAMRLVKELDVGSVDELEEALRQGRVAELSHMGDKTAANLLRGVESRRAMEQRTPIGIAMPIAEEIIAQLQMCPGLLHVSLAGSLRRLKDTVGDIGIVGAAMGPQAILEAFVGLPQVRELLNRGTNEVSVVVGPGLRVELRLVDPDMFGSSLWYFTGSKQHNIALAEWGHLRGLEISQYGITDLSSGMLEKFSTEEEFYSRLRLQFIPPELREGTGEIEKAEQGVLPILTELRDIKGDLHVHTEWSDGKGSIEAMAAAARSLGYQYLAITDHSAGRGIAHGLREERLRKQMAEISDINARGVGPYVFSGIEVDIRADGVLDLSEELLGELDIVIAAVHSAMGQDKDTMTRRILRALENPNVDILAHPSCRLLGERGPVAVDWEAVFQAAARTGTALEINAMPSRLDLKDLHVFQARKLGARFVIDTDSHSPSQLGYMRFGVGVARRGWCETGNIVNALSLKEIMRQMERDRSHC